MFSGIVMDLGRLVSVTPRGAGSTLLIETGFPVDDGSRARGQDAEPGLRLGDSVAVMGACLTVEALHPPRRFTVSCGRETLERTTLGAVRPGDRLHLERALRLGDRLDGHMVSVKGQLDLHYVPFQDLVNCETLKTEVRYIRPGSDFHRLARFLETRVDPVRDWSPGPRKES